MAADAIDAASITIAKGVVTFQEGANPTVDLGECSNFVYTTDITRKDYYTNRSGIRTKLKSVVTTVGATVKMTLNSINDYNLGLAVLASSSTTGLEGLTDTQRQGVITFTGSNDIGTQVTFTASCQLQPGGDVVLINDADDWMALPINCEILVADGSYGTWSTTGETTA